MKKANLHSKRYSETFLRMRVLLAFVMFALLPITAASAATGPTAVVVGGDTVDLGRVRPGRVVDTIAIANIGGDTLRLGRMGSGCGCLAATVDRPEVAPGDTAHVVVTIEATGSVAEAFDKVLSIATNDPGRPVVAVRVRATLARDLRVTSLLNTVRREPCPPGGCTWEIVLENTSDGPVTVYPPVMEEVRGMEVTVADPRTLVLAPGERATAAVRVSVTDGEAVPMARLLFLTNSVNDPEVRASFFYAPDATR